MKEFAEELATDEREDGETPRYTSPIRTPLPPDAKVQLLIDEPERTVFFIPPGKHGKAIIIFSAIWLVFIGAALISKLANFGAKPIKNEISATIVIAIFTLLGVVMLFIGLKEMFERTLVLVEPTRLAIERNFLGWKRSDEINLNHETTAELVVAYTKNYEPVYSVCVNGIERKIRFGSGLSTPEKNWLVDYINSFLNAPVSIVDAEMRVTDLESMTDAELESRLTQAGFEVERPTPLGVEIHRKMLSTKVPLRTGISVIAGAVAIGIFLQVSGFFGVMFNNGGAAKVVSLVMLIPLGLFVAGIITLTIIAAFGKLSIVVTPLEISRTYGVGNFRHRQAFRIDDLYAIDCATDEADNPRVRSNKNKRSRSAMKCIARTRDKSMTLYLSMNNESCEALTAFLRKHVDLVQRLPTEHA